MQYIFSNHLKFSSFGKGQQLSYLLKKLLILDKIESSSVFNLGTLKKFQQVERQNDAC